MLSTKSADKRKQQMYLLDRLLMFRSDWEGETNVFVIVRILAATDKMYTMESRES